MIRLYEATETEFTSNGLGTLNDCTECKVTEERNGQFELSMQYPVNGKHYRELTYDRIIFAKPNPYTDPQAFQIYKIQDGLHGTCHVWAEHISYRLSKIPCSPFTADTCALALAGLKTHAAETCPFNFSTDKEITTTYTQKKPASIRARLGGEDGSILDLYRGEFEFDNFNVILWMNRGKNRGVTVKYGKNLTDFNQEKNIQDTYTAVYPYYYGSNEDEEEVLVTLPEVVIDTTHASSFPIRKTLALDLSDKFEGEAPTVAELRTACQNYITENKVGVPKVSVKFNFAALRQTQEYEDVVPLEKVYLCDTVKVDFTELGITAEAEVIKTVYNVLTDRYDSIEIGDAKSSLSSTIVGQSEYTEKEFAKTKSDYEIEMDRLFNVFKGAYGGHVIFNTNANGQINSIYVMDTTDVNTATKILWISQAGIAMSSQGFGNFNSVWDLQNGTFNGEAINVINLLATNIVGGIIRDRTGNNYWNLDTGEFVLGALESATQSNSEAIQQVEDTLDIFTDSISVSGSTVAIGQGTSITQGVISTQKVAIAQTLAIGNHAWLSRSNGTNTTVVYIGGTN